MAPSARISYFGRGFGISSRVGSSNGKIRLGVGGPWGTLGAGDSISDTKSLVLTKSSLVYTPTTHKKRRRALRALFSDKSLQVRVSFQRGREAWLAEFEKRWGRNNEAALVARPTLRVQSNAEIPRAHGQRTMYDL